MDVFLNPVCSRKFCNVLTLRTLCHLVCVCPQEWWTHLWLNEGFASWIEYLCVDHCFPEYDIWTQFVSADYTRALDLDALDSSHAIEVSRGPEDVVTSS